ncbi:MAG TPA: efflux transporter outer membrane subunit [Casimicrobiaceae bacterium]|nr:efflux transporter outer membrane subunit [Casimicrobiaceae bacterium]
MFSVFRAFRFAVPLTLAALLAACAATPTAPPQLELPTQTTQAPAQPTWWTAFNDAKLTALIEEALAHNLDLRAAVARIEEARTQIVLAQQDQFPNINLGVDALRSRSTEVGTNPLPPGFTAFSNDFRIGLNASYEVDFWSKYRSATQAARNDLLATQFARETIRTTVAADVARTYFNLLATDAELALLRDTLQSRDESVALQRDRFAAGVVGEFDLVTAEAERAAVAADIAGDERAIAEYESALTVLLGRSPREVFEPTVAREDSVARLLDVPTIPSGLPSDLLARRPDVRQAESQLAAASLRVDVARADYFPSLSLTAGLGTESGALRHLFSGPAAIWSIGASLVQPLTELRAIDANVEAARARREQVTVDYVKTVQTAFRETHDALVANRSTRDALSAESVRREKLQRALELADIRYRSGYSPYLEVLDAQRQLLAAQTLEIGAARNARLAVIDLAKALGGGWDYQAALVSQNQEMGNRK